MTTVNTSPAGRRELRYLRELRRRIGANLYLLENVSRVTNATQIGQTAVHGFPRMPHQPGGMLDISANDFKLLISAGIVSPAVRVPHSRDLYNMDILLAELEHFAVLGGGSSSAV